MEKASSSTATSSASASELNKLPYDVYINHQGSDVKNKLASTIYHTLDLMGLRTFFDKTEFQLGDGTPLDQIQQAMVSASLHIAIISPNYAQSPLCLEELSFMLQTGTRILPIFYNVEPSDVRRIYHGKGVYADAFSEHEENGRYTPEKLDEWKKALYKISSISGYEVNENEDEGRQLKNVVDKVLRFMEKIPLEVAKHPVGMDEIVWGFQEMTLQSAESQTVKIVGIVGMGGSGKTTLAKEFFNRKCSSFDRRSFIFDIRESAATNALLNKQEQLLRDLGDFRIHSLPLSSISQGKAILANRLKSLRVLIVLDDVDHIDQMDALLPNMTFLGSDSIVIVTTRDLGVLRSAGISGIYRMPRLSRSNATELFCWHAFSQPNPPYEFEELVKKFVMACKGLPLSLRLLGGELHGHSFKGYWESELDKYSKILHPDIKRKIELSFHALDREQQEIFLDAACFFIGEDKSVAVSVWDGSGWSGLHGWETLVNKCLVELDKNNHITMHDHLRDMGREIAFFRSPYRVWSAEQILNVRKSGEETVLIRGITAAATEDIRDITGYNHFSYRTSLKKLMKVMRILTRGLKQPGLQLLVVRGNVLNQKVAKLSRDLIWLRWFEFEHERIPPWLSLRNLRCLELRQPKALQELWENADPPLQLRQLIITLSSSFKKFPKSIGLLKHLEKVALLGNANVQMSSITELPEEFCLLQSLEHLELRYCTMLSSLPSGFGDLTSLQHIDLLGCRELRMLPDSIKHLTRLQYLDLSDCMRLSICSDTLEIISALENLVFFRFKDVKKGSNLIDRPHASGSNQSSNRTSMKEPTILRITQKDETTSPAATRQLDVSEIIENYLMTNQASRTELKIFGSVLKFPKSIGQLQHLEIIVVDGCVNTTLKSLPDEFCHLKALRHFTLRLCRALTSLPTHFGNLKSLQHLDIGFCNQLKELPNSFKQLKQLKYLNFEGCSKLGIPPHFLGQIRTLQHLNFKDCARLTVLPTHVPCQLSLRSLNLLGTSLEELPNEVGMLITLEVLEIGSPYLTDLPVSIGNMMNLLQLNVEGCTNLTCLPGTLRLLDNLTINAPQDLKETLEEIVEEIPNRRCGIF